MPIVSVAVCTCGWPTCLFNHFHKKIKWKYKKLLLFFPCQQNWPWNITNYSVFLSAASHSLHQEPFQVSPCDPSVWCWSCNGKWLYIGTTNITTTYINMHYNCTLMFSVTQSLVIHFHGRTSSHCIISTWGWENSAWVQRSMQWLWNITKTASAIINKYIPI